MGGERPGGVFKRLVQGFTARYTARKIREIDAVRRAFLLTNQCQIFGHLLTPQFASMMCRWRPIPIRLWWPFPSRLPENTPERADRYVFDRMRDGDARTGAVQMDELLVRRAALTPLQFLRLPALFPEPPDNFVTGQAFDHFRPLVMCIIYTLAAVPSSRKCVLSVYFWVAREAAGTFVNADPKVGPNYEHSADMKTAALRTA